MSPSHPEQEDRWRRVALGALVFAIAVSPILAADYLPLVDYYRHAIRFYVLAADLAGRPYPDVYEPDWGLYPNLGADVLAMPLFIAFPPKIAAQLLLVVICLMLYAGVATLARAEQGRASGLAFLLAGLLLFNHILHWGFINSLVGFALALFAVAAYVRVRETSMRAAAAVAVAASVPIYLAHGFSYVVFGVVLASWEVGRMLELRRLSLRRGALALGALALTAVPAAALVYLTGFTGQGLGRDLLGELSRRFADGTILEKAREVIGDRATIVFRQLETESLALDLVFNGVAIVAVAAMLATGAVQMRRRWWVVLSALLALFCVMPSTVLGVGYVADRLPTYAAFIFAAVARPVTGRWPALFAGSALAFRTVALWFFWSQHAPAQRAAEMWADLIPPNAIVVGLYGALTEQRENFKPRCTMLPAPFVWLSGAAVWTFNARGVQPIRVDPAVNRALTGDRPLPPWPTTDAQALRRNEARLRSVAGGGASFVITCHERFFPVDPAELMDRVAVAGPFTLYRTRGPRDPG